MENKSKSKGSKSSQGSRSSRSADGTSSSGNVMSNLFGKSDNEKSLKEVFIKELLDVYDAEQQLIEALPEMAEAAYNEELADAFTDHLEETKKQARRLEKIFSRIHVDKNDAEKCAAMEGLIEEGRKV